MDSSAEAMDSTAESVEGECSVEGGVLFDGEAPQEVAEPPITGDAAVDGVLQQIAAVVTQSLDSQVPVYDAVHRALQDRLADVED